MKTHCATCGSPLLRGGGLDKLCGACLFEGSRRPPAADLPDRLEQEEVARLFPELEILEPLGRGGMGVVWRARQKRLDREVALKLLRPELAAEPDFAERFQREARALARLSHPNVVVVHDFGEQRGRYYLLMEFVKGVSLRDLIRDGRLTPPRVLEIVPEICAGLQYAHGNGVIHRDIKPENILIDAEGHVRIADFGLAKMLGQDEPGLTRGSQVMGTYEYMAPEQIYRPLEVDHRADVYSLGVVLYEMLTGDLPRGRFASPSEKVPMDRRLDDVVAKALQEEREARYQSMGQVQSDVEEISRSSKLHVLSAQERGLPREAPPLPGSPRGMDGLGWRQDRPAGPARGERGPAAVAALGEGCESTPPVQASSTQEALAKDRFLLHGDLNWIGSLGIKPTTLLGLTLAVAYATFAILVSSKRNFNGVRLELFGLCYPFAWLVLTLLRTRATGLRRRTWTWTLAGLALLLAWLSLVLVCAGDIPAAGSMHLLPAFIACGLLIVAHGFLERAVRARDVLAGTLTIACLLVAAVIFASSPYKSAYNAKGFFLGMGAILCGASLAIWMPSAFLTTPGLSQRRALLSMTGIGLLLSFLYFAPLL